MTGALETCNYTRPMDWSKQADKYKKKVRAYYEEENEKYDTFCQLQLKKIPEIETPTSEEKEEAIRGLDETQGK
jgi:hypothetical protein